MRKWVLATLMLLVTAFVQAQIPRTLSYQGRLANEAGVAIEGDQTLTLRLYALENDDEALWQEQHVTRVENGLFAVLLGSITPLELPFDQPYWLGVTIGTGDELTPRMPLSSSAYSLNARTVADGSVTAAKLAPGLSIPPGGTAGGDLTGNFPTPTVTGLNGNPLSSATPATGQVLKWSGSTWGPSADNSGASYWSQSTSNNIKYSGDIEIGAGASSDFVSEAMIFNGKSKQFYLGVANSDADDPLQFYLSSTTEPDGTFNVLYNSFLHRNTIQMGGICISASEGPHIFLAQSTEIDLSEIISGWSQHIDRNTGSFKLCEAELYLNNWGYNHRITITRSGKLGLGYGEPTHELHIRHENTSEGGAVAGLKLENWGANRNWWALYTANSNGDLMLYFKDDFKGKFKATDGSYEVGSDRRLKTDIAPLKPVLDRVLALRPSSYRFKSSPQAETKSLGLIAQEVEPLFPELVSSTGEDEDLKTLEYQGFSVLAIKAIQEQQALIEKLTARIEALERQVR